MHAPTHKPPQRRGTALNLPGISQDSQPADPSSKLIIVMVGLPARGKSYITNKLTRYLNWLQLECRVFNVGNTRRNEVDHVGPSKTPLPDSIPTSHDATFFNPKNKESFNMREKWAMDTLDHLLDFVLLQGGSVGIFDATNSTKMRRLKIFNKIRERNEDIKILYLESICTDQAIIDKNIQLKLNGPDYVDMDKDVALKDFTNRLKNYELAYQTIEDDEELQYIKMIDVGKKIITYKIQGFLPSQTIYYLLNFNLQERQIWLTRNAESWDNVHGKLGGDSSITNKGVKFSKALARFINFKRDEFAKAKPETSQFFNIWTSSLKRSVDTSQYFKDTDYTIRKIKTLCDLSCGDFEGLTYQEFQALHPSEFNSRLTDKLNFRYPGSSGESYLDVINRIKPIINEIERTSENLLVISHRVVIRILLSYFLNLDKEILTNLNVPLNHVFLLEPKPFGVEWSLFKYDETKDWFDKVQDDEFLKVQEKDVEFNKRRYSVVPIASRTPSSSSFHRTNSNSSAARPAVDRSPSTTSSTSSSSPSLPARTPAAAGAGAASSTLFNPRFHDPLNSLNKDRVPRGVMHHNTSVNNRFNKNPFDPKYVVDRDLECAIDDEEEDDVGEVDPIAGTLNEALRKTKM
jgi:6-phosphofructo-2-kinase